MAICTNSALATNDFPLFYLANQCELSLLNYNFPPLIFVHKLCAILIFYPFAFANSLLYHTKSRGLQYFKYKSSEFLSLFSSLSSEGKKNMWTGFNMT